MRLVRWCDALIRVSYYLLFALVPLLLTPLNYELFEYNKMMAVYALTVITVAAWLTKSIARKEFRIAKTPLDIPLGLFFLSQLISAVFSMDPHVSWFGYYSRFNGGMLSVISYLLLYYTAVSNPEVFGVAPSADSKPERSQNAKTRKNESAVASSAASATPAIMKLLLVALVSAAFVALYGVAEHFGIDKNIWVQDVQNRVFSTLGQPNWLAAYLVALIPLSWYFALRQGWKRPVFWGYALLSALFFVVLLYTRSRSGLLGLAVADAVFWVSLLVRPSSGKPWSQRVAPIFAIHLVFAAIVVVNGVYIEQIDRYVTLRGWQSLLSQKKVLQPEPAAAPTGYVAPALESGGTASTTIRKYVWEGAISAWKSSTKTKLIGTGTETFAWAFFRFKPVAHNTTSEWDYLYNKAHNEYLNFLATTGAFGLGSYLLLLAVFAAWAVIANRRAAAESDLRHLNAALFAGWSSILVTNFFGFSVVITQIFLFLYPAILILISRPQGQTRTIAVRLPSWSRWIPAAAATVLLIELGLFWYADKRFARGYQEDRAGYYAQANPDLTAAATLNPGEPLYHDELAGNLATLAVAAFESKDATGAARFAKLAIDENARALSISPNNVNFLKSKTRVYYTLSALDPALNQAAVDTLLKASTLSPTDPKIYYNLAILEGRQGNNDRAIAYLLKAKELKKDYRDAYNALNIFYGETGKKQEAKAILEEYLKTVNPGDKEFLERVK